MFTARRNPFATTRNRAVATAVTLATLAVGVAATATVTGEPVQAATGTERLIVELETHRDTDTAAARVAAAVDGTVISTLESTPVAVLDVPTANIDDLLAHGDITDVYADELLSPADVPDPVILHETGTSGPAQPQPAATTLGLPAAHAAGLDGRGLVVAVLDSGVDLNHPYLKSQIVGQACFSTTQTSMKATSTCPGGQDSTTAGGTNCPTSVTGCDHGTHVAGIIAGTPTTVGTQELTGVAPAAKILAIQVFSRFDNPTVCGSPQPCALSYTSDVLAALDHVAAYAEKHRTVAAVNMSLGSGKYTAPCTGSAGKDVINRIRLADASVVAAMGNEAQSDAGGWPACVPGVVSVAATGAGASGTDYDQVAGYSNVASWTITAAPGTFISSALPGNEWAALSGTSMATPETSGALTLYRQKYPDIAGYEREWKLVNDAKAIYDSRSRQQLRRISLTKIAPPQPAPKPTPTTTTTLKPTTTTTRPTTTTTTTRPATTTTRPTTTSTTLKPTTTTTTRPTTTSKPITTTTTRPTTTTAPPAPPAPTDNQAPSKPVLTAPAGLLDATRTVPVAATATDNRAVVNYEIRRRIGVDAAFTPWATIAHTATGKWTGTGSPGATYCFTVVAVDAADNRSPESDEACRTVPFDDRNFSRSGQWSSKYQSAAYQSTTTATTFKGATLTGPSVTARRVYIIATRCPTCGTITVDVPGAARRTLRLQAATTVKSQFIHVATVTTPKKGNITVTVATSGRPIEIDGMVISAR